jgi:hypothetical protein
MEPSGVKFVFSLGRASLLRTWGRMDLMSTKNILRKLTNWAVMAFVAAVLYVFITPSYRQGEPSIAGKKAEDFPLTVAGRQTRLSEFRGKSSFSIFGHLTAAPAWKRCQT